MIIKVHFTDRFPSVSHPVYCEIRNENYNSSGYGHIEYWNAFRNEKEMREFMHKLFSRDVLLFVGMKA